MIRGIQGGRAIIFYFLQPDKHGNLILRGKESPPEYTNKYIIEEYFPKITASKSYITPSWTGITKTFIWRAYNGFKPKEDRKLRLLQILIQLFGYSNKTHPTLEKIIRMTYGDKDNDIKFDDDIWINNESIIKYHKKTSEHSKNIPIKKEFIPLLQAERLLLTEGQFERDSYTAALRKKRLLKLKIKKNLSKIKCGCKNE